MQQRPTGKHRACLWSPQPEPAELKCTKAQASASFKRAVEAAFSAFPIIFPSFWKKRIENS